MEMLTLPMGFIWVIGSKVSASLEKITMDSQFVNVVVSINRLANICVDVQINK